MVWWYGGVHAALFFLPSNPNPNPITFISHLSSLLPVQQIVCYDALTATNAILAPLLSLSVSLCFLLFFCRLSCGSRSRVVDLFSSLLFSCLLFLIVSFPRRHGMARHGTAWHGMARHGTVWHFNAEDPWSQGSERRREWQWHFRRMGSACDRGWECEGPVAHLLGCFRGLVASLLAFGRASESPSPRRPCRAGAVAVATGPAVPWGRAHLRFRGTVLGSLGEWSWYWSCRRYYYYYYRCWCCC